MTPDLETITTLRERLHAVSLDWQISQERVKELEKIIDSERFGCPTAIVTLSGDAEYWKERDEVAEKDRDKYKEEADRRTREIELTYQVQKDLRKRAENAEIELARFKHMAESYSTEVCELQEKLVQAEQRVKEVLE